MNTDRASPDHGSYNHPLMVRGKPELCLGMFRQRIKGNFNKCGSAAGGNNNRSLQPEVKNPTPVVTLSEFFLGQETNPVCESMLNEEADSEPDFDHHHEPVLASTQSRLGGDGFNENDDLLTFAILANDYIAQTMKSSSSMDGGNPLAAALVPDASSSGRRWLLHHDGSHGVLQQQE